jgi:hypothetical protein
MHLFTSSGNSPKMRKPHSPAFMRAGMDLAYAKIIYLRSFSHTKTDHREENDFH